MCGPQIQAGLLPDKEVSRWFNHAIYRLADRVQLVFSNLEKVVNQWLKDGYGLF